MKISSLILGKAKGSAGNVTVVQLKGQTILKQKASIVANPRTPLQMAQRAMINRAVYAWQLVGNAIKSGWTSLLPYASQYNTFVSANSNFFKNAVFDQTNFKNEDLIGVQSTKGRFPVLPYIEDTDDGNSRTYNVDLSSISHIAKVGDKIKVVAGGKNKSDIAYSEITLVQSAIDNNSSEIIANLTEDLTNAPLVVACWFESADGKESSTSYFVEK